METIDPQPLTPPAQPAAGVPTAAPVTAAPIVTPPSGELNLPEMPKTSHRGLWATIAVLLIVAIGALVSWYYLNNLSTDTETADTPAVTTTKSTDEISTATTDISTQVDALDTDLATIDEEIASTDDDTSDL